MREFELCDRSLAHALFSTGRFSFVDYCRCVNADVHRGFIRNRHKSRASLNKAICKAAGLLRGRCTQELFTRRNDETAFCNRGVGRHFCRCELRRAGDAGGAGRTAERAGHTSGRRLRGRLAPRTEWRLPPKLCPAVEACVPARLVSWPLWPLPRQRHLTRPFTDLVFSPLTP